MPAFPFSQALTANQLGFNPLTAWQLERIPAAWPNGAAVKLITNATDVNVRLTIYSGTTTIMERAPVQGGGAVGVIPAELNTAPITWIAQPDDRLKLSYDNVSAGTPTVNGIIVVEPI